MDRSVQDDEQFSRCGWTPWRDHVVKGWPIRTYVNGLLAFRREDRGRGEVVADTRGVEVDFEASGT